MGKLNCTKPVDKGKRPGRPFNSTKATLVRHHSPNQSRMESFFSSKNNSTEASSSDPTTNPEPLIENPSPSPDISVTLEVVVGQKINLNCKCT